jgi:hypothetical protein
MKTVLIIIGVVLLILAVLYFVFWRDKQAEEEAQSSLPPSVQRLVPTSWNVIQEETCDFDSDGQAEWLVVYHYDSAAVEPPNQPAGTKVTVSPIGAVIYDAELESPPQAGSGQYQTTTITPYKLLPDYAYGKGLGYLGESAVQLLLFPPVAKDGTCQPQEVGFLGYSDGYTSGPTGLPTRLSLFHWAGASLGYQGSLLIGNARIATTIPTDPKQFITDVTTDNLLNDRSLLCQSTGYTRAGPVAEFYTVPGSTTLDFCYGAPGEPTYPEGAVAALLRNNEPRAANDETKMPPGNSFLLPGVSLPAGLVPPVSILAITNTASAAPVPGGGHLCTLEYSSGGEGWWCGQLAAVVTSEVPVNGVVREVAWNMISVSQKNVVAEVHWRISNVELR